MNITTSTSEYTGQSNFGENLMSTKFIGSMSIIIMAYGLVFAGLLDATTWLELATAVVGIYSTANVVQKFSK